MRVLNKGLCVVAVLGLATFLANDASAQCSTVNPSCDFACSVLKYCPGPIACNTDTDCGVGRGPALVDFVEAVVQRAAVTQLVRQISVALARLGTHPMHQFSVRSVRRFA